MGERAAAAAGDDVGDGMQCADHPHRASPGGICAFCLQEKLGKLVSSSSSPSSFFPPLPPTSSTSSTSSSFRSSSDFPPTSSKILTFLNNKTKKQPPPPPAVSTSAPPAPALPLKRSKSVAPRPAGDFVAAAADSPRKKSFWSFLSLSSSSSSSSAATTTTDKRRSTDVQPQFTLQHQDDESTIVKTTRDRDEESPGGGSQASSSSFGRKVSRSRSVGCGSRSFSGDFLERISTGFGDCALRRVESHRESNNNKHGVMPHHERRIKERVRCGGIFGGFGMLSSSSSLWLSAAAEDDDDDFGSTSSRMSSSSNTRRSRNWGWAFASPMRAFRPVISASKSFGPANAVAGINSSSRGARIGNGNGNPQSSSLAAVVGS